MEFNKPIINRERKIVRLWIVLTLLFLGGIFVPGLLGIGGMEGGFAIAFICAFLVIMGIIVILVYNQRARRMEKLIQGDQLLASWTYSSEEWRSYADYDFEEDKVTKRSMFRMVAIIALVVGAIMTIILKHIVVPLTILGIIGLIAIPAFIGPKIRHGRNVDSLGKVLISSNAVYLNGAFYSWDMLGARLDHAGIERSSHPHCLVIDYSYPTRTGIQTDTVRIPIPQGKEGEALMVVRALLRPPPR